MCGADTLGSIDATARQLGLVNMWDAEFWSCWYLSCKKERRDTLKHREQSLVDVSMPDVSLSPDQGY